MTPERSLTTQVHEPLVAVVVEEDGREVVRYVVDDGSDAPSQPSADAQAALAAIGAWSDLDWDELADDLDRIRHASPPTPPVAPDDV